MTTGMPCPLLRTLILGGHCFLGSPLKIVTARAWHPSSNTHHANGSASSTARVDTHAPCQRQHQQHSTSSTAPAAQHHANGSTSSTAPVDAHTARHCRCCPMQPTVKCFRRVAHDEQNARHRRAPAALLQEICTSTHCGAVGSIPCHGTPCWCGIASAQGHDPHRQCEWCWLDHVSCCRRR